MDGHSSWARAPEDGPAQPDYPESPGWYGEREWRGEQPSYGGASDLGPPEPRSRPESERYDSQRFDDQRYEDPRYDELRRDPLRPEPNVSELPRVEPPRPVDTGTGRMPPVGPRPGPPAPSAPPVGEAVAARRPVSAPASPGPVGDNVYRSKRPAVAALFGVAAGILEIPALLLLRAATFDDPVSVSGVIAGACLVLALPMTAVGLYAVATGAVRAAGPNSVQAWLRPPVAYLSVALVLFLAAGLAG